jgi:hypothetical protein
MNKLNQAMRMCIDATNALIYAETNEQYATAKLMMDGAQAAFREALADHVEQNLTMVADHSGDANEMVAEPAIPEWVDVDDYEEPVKQEPVAWQGAEEWEPLAFQLCADENGEESCNELLWDGGVIPEPWGERWLKYEDEAKRMIEYVRKYAATVRTKDLTDDEIEAICADLPFDENFDITVARAVIAADRENNK